MTQYRIKAANARDLVEQVEAQIAGGALHPGEQLPSVRKLAAQTGLSPATVATAMSELRRRGVVIAGKRRATRIAPAPPVSALRALLPVPSGARDLSSGNPDPALLPRLTRALRRAGASTDLYGTSSTLAELAELAQEGFKAD